MPCPTRLTPGERPSTHCTESWMGLRVGVAVPVCRKSSSSWNISLSHKALGLCVNVAGTDSILEGCDATRASGRGLCGQVSGRNYGLRLFSSLNRTSGIERLV